MKITVTRPVEKPPVVIPLSSLPKGRIGVFVTGGFIGSYVQWVQFTSNRWVPVILGSNNRWMDEDNDYSDYKVVLVDQSKEITIKYYPYRHSFGVAVNE